MISMREIEARMVKKDRCAKNDGSKGMVVHMICRKCLTDSNNRQYFSVSWFGKRKNVCDKCYYKK